MFIIVLKHQVTGHFEIFHNYIFNNKENAINHKNEFIRNCNNIHLKLDCEAPPKCFIPDLHILELKEIKENEL